MHPQEMTWGIIMALLLGMFGQGIRAVAGTKKLTDGSANRISRFKNSFDLTRFLVSLFIGAIAGIAAYLAYWANGNEEIVGTVLYGIVAAGYSGTDFIEAFVRKRLPQGSGG